MEETLKGLIYNKLYSRFAINTEMINQFFVSIQLKIVLFIIHISLWTHGRSNWKLVQICTYEQQTMRDFKEKISSEENIIWVKLILSRGGKFLGKMLYWKWDTFTVLGNYNKTAISSRKWECSVHIKRFEYRPPKIFLVTLPLESLVRVVG